ncbi:hypothetical protein FALCPG4_012409 [Fusarium falciforme]
MSFGFSVGDFLAAAQLAHKIRKDFSGAPSQFKSLSDETKLLSMVLQDVDVKVDESVLTPQQGNNLEQAMGTCEAVLHDLQAICDKFSDLDTSQGRHRKCIRRVWKQLKWEPNEARELRERISSSIAMLTTLLSQLSSETTVTVKKGVDRLNQNQDRQERLAILNWLSSFDHTAQQNDISARKQTGTGVWLLESPEFTSWNSTRGETLYCPGIPGAGKTILSSIVVEELTKRFRDDSNVCIAHVYFNYQQQESQTVNQVFANLLRQLVAGQSDIPTAVRDVYKGHLQRGSKPKFEEISELLHSFSALYSRVFIIIDALDECPSRDGRRNTLLSEIMKLQTALSANILCTSRPIPEIESWFPKAVSINVRASEHDVRKYLDGQIGRLPGFVARSTELQEHVKTQIVQVVDGMFLLAHLHLESLMYKRTAKALRTALEGLPRGSTAYDDTYERTMRRIETQFPEQAGLAKDVLQWIIWAKTPLSVSELQHALGVEPEEEHLDFDNLPDPDDMVTACGGLVTVDQGSGIIRLVHYTTQEYFERTRKTWFPAAEEQLAEVCLTYLSFEPFRREQCKTSGEHQRRLEDWPFYRYACKYWGLHASQASSARTLAFFQLKEAFWSSLQPLFQDQTGSIYTEHDHNEELFESVKEQVTALHIAALFGLVSIVRELADPDTVNKQTDQGWTPLAFAAEQGRDEVIRLLLVEYGANANLSDEGGTSPLHRAVSRHRTSSFKLLLEIGKANIHSRDLAGETPLYLAILEDQVEIVEYLVDNLETWLQPPEDPELQPGLILRTAAACGRVGIVKLLSTRPHLDLDVSGNTILRWIGAEQRPPLVWAARDGQCEVCKILVEAGRVNANVVDSTGRTALSYAIERNSTEIIDILLQVDNIYIGSVELGVYRSPLSFAVAQGSEETVGKLFATNRLNPNDALLAMAASENWRGVASVLLDGPPLDTSAKYHQDKAPISHAAEKGGESIVEALSRYNANPGLRGRNLLGCAAERGDTRIVEALLRFSANINSKGLEERIPPLSHAAEKGDARIVDAFIRYNTKINSKDLWDRTPLSYAAEGGHEEIVEALLRMRNIEVDSKSENASACFAGCTPLAFAAYKGHPRIVQRLLDTGQVNPNSKSSISSQSRTPLIWAIEGSWYSYGDVEKYEAVVDLLLRTRRVDVNSKCATGLPSLQHQETEGQTPLLIATRRSTPPKIVKLLLENGADPNVTSHDGSTPLSNAIENGYSAIADILLEYGAKPLEE